MGSNWTTPIDIYCERTDPAFWAEPVNAVTNTAFLLAAFLCLLRWRRHYSCDWPALALIVVLSAIGIGSFLFHTFADRWSVLADVIPITIFIYVYFFFAMRRFFEMRPLPAVLVTMAFLGVTLLVDNRLPPGFLNGSGGYLPPAAAILAVGALMLRRRPQISRPVLAAGAILVASIAARSVDMAVCPAVPLGTHFIWHLLNALTLYILINVLMTARPRPEGGKTPASGRR